MKIFRTDPVQEIAAEQDTLLRFTVALDPDGPRPQSSSKLRAALPRGIDGFGLPVAIDPGLPAGEVHFRPHPTAPTPDPRGA